MDSWSEVALGDVLAVKHGYAFKGKHFNQDGTNRLVTPGNFHERGGFKDRGRTQRSYSGPIPDDYRLAPGSLVVAMTEQSPGLLGSAALIPEDEFAWLHNQRIGLVVLDETTTSKKFIYHLLNSPFVRSCLSETATGTKVRHTAPKRIEAVRVQLPPHSEQRRIAAVLSAFDQLIEINERRIELLEDLARSLYREWFVHFRFPGHEEVEFVDSEVGPLPDKWNVCAVGDVASINSNTLKPSQLPDPFLYLDISSLRVGSIGELAVLPAAEAPGRARRGVADGDTVWATVRPNRRAHAQIHDPPSNVIASTGLAVISPTHVPSSFLFQYLASPAFGDHLVGRATGSAYPAVRPTDFRGAPFVLPPEPLLADFDAIGDPILRLRSQLRRQNLRFAATRDLLLPRLVTGKNDISDIDLGVLTLEDTE